MYSGRPFQGGHGLGGALLGLIRSATPIFKTLGKTLLRAGVGVADDMLHGGQLTTSLKNRRMAALKNLTGRARPRADIKKKPRKKTPVKL